MEGEERRRGGTHKDKGGDASLVVFECLPPHPFINLSYVSSSFLSSLDDIFSRNTEKRTSEK